MSVRHLAAKTEESTMQRLFMLSASIAVVTWAANAFADSPNLMGAYGFTRTVKCIVSHTGFDSNNRALDG